MESTLFNHLKLASAGYDVILWETSNYSLLNRFDFGAADPIGNIHWSPDYKQIVTVPSSVGKIMLTFVKQKILRHTYFTTGEKNTVAKFSSVSPRFLAIGTKSGRTLIWDIKHKKCTKCFFTQKSEITSLQYNFNASYLAVGFINGKILVHNVTSGHSSILCNQQNGVVRELQYSYHTKALIGSITDDGTLTLWDANTKGTIRSFPACHNAPTTGLSFSPSDQSMLASVGLDKIIKTYDLRTKNVVGTMKCSNPLSSIDIKEDKFTLAVGSTRGEVLIFDLRSKKQPIFILPAHNSVVGCVMFQKTERDTAPKAFLEDPLHDMRSEDNEVLGHAHQMSETPHIDSETSFGKDKFLAICTKRPSLTTIAFSPLVSSATMCSSDPNLSFSEACGKIPELKPINRRLSFSFTPSVSYRGRDSLDDIFSPVVGVVSGVGVERFDLQNQVRCPISQLSEDSGDSQFRMRSSRDEKDQPSRSLDIQNFSKAVNNFSGTSDLQDVSIGFNAPMNNSTREQNSYREIYNISIPYSDEESNMTVIENKAHSNIADETFGSEEDTLKHSIQSPPAFPEEYVKKIVSDCVEDFKDDMRQQLVRFQIRMIREQSELINEIWKMQVQKKREDDLIAELNMLKFENEFYRSLFR